jgi:hypothetical protein
MPKSRPAKQAFDNLLALDRKMYASSIGYLARFACDQTLDVLATRARGATHCATNCRIIRWIEKNQALSYPACSCRSLPAKNVRCRCYESSAVETFFYTFLVP